MAIQSFNNNFNLQAATGVLNAHGQGAYGNGVFANDARVKRVKVSVLNQAPLYCIKAPGMIMFKITGLAAKAAVCTTSATWNWLKKSVAPMPQIQASDHNTVVLAKLVVGAWRGAWRPLSNGCRALETWMVDRVQSLVVPKSDPVSMRDDAMMKRMGAIAAKINDGDLVLAWLRAKQAHPCMGWNEWFLANAKGALASAVDAEAMAMAAGDLRVLCEKSKKILKIEPKLHQLASAMRTIAHEEFMQPSSDMVSARIAELYQERDAALERLSQLHQRRISEKNEIAVMRKLVEIACAAPQGWTARLLDLASFGVSRMCNSDVTGVDAVEAGNYKAQSAAIIASFGSRIASWIALSAGVRTSVNAIGELGDTGLSLAREGAKRKVAIKLTQLTSKTLCTGGFVLIAWSAALSSFGRHHMCIIESKFMPEKLLLLQGCDPKNDELISVRQMILVGLVISSLITYRSELLQWLHQRQHVRGGAMFAGSGLDSVLPRPRTLIALATTKIANSVSGVASFVGISIGQNLQRFNQRSISEMNRIFGLKREASLPRVAPQLTSLDCIQEESPNQTPD